MNDSLSGSFARSDPTELAAICPDRTKGKQTCGRTATLAVASIAADRTEGAAPRDETALIAAARCLAMLSPRMICAEGDHRPPCG